MIKIRYIEFFSDKNVTIVKKFNPIKLPIYYVSKNKTI